MLKYVIHLLALFFGIYLSHLFNVPAMMENSAVAVGGFMAMMTGASFMAKVGYGLTMLFFVCLFIVVSVSVIKGINANNKIKVL
jgi:hypothetical protein